MNNPKFHKNLLLFDSTHVYFISRGRKSPWIPHQPQKTPLCWGSNEPNLLDYLTEGKLPPIPCHGRDSRGQQPAAVLSSYPANTLRLCFFFKLSTHTSVAPSTDQPDLIPCADPRAA